MGLSKDSIQDGSVPSVDLHQGSAYRDMEIKSTDNDEND